MSSIVPTSAIFRDLFGTEEMRAVESHLGAAPEMVDRLLATRQRRRAGES